jgi:hypothetical protein
MCNVLLAACLFGNVELPFHAQARHSDGPSMDAGLRNALLGWMLLVCLGELLSSPGLFAR